LTIDHGELMLGDGGLLLNGDLVVTGGAEAVFGPEGLTVSGTASLSGDAELTQTSGAAEIGGDLDMSDAVRLIQGTEPLVVGGHVNVGSGTLIESLPMEEGADYRVAIEATSMLVDAGASISTVGKGYPAKTWLGWQTRELGNTMGGSHGGHGARGSNTNQEITVNPAYGTLADPNEAGAGGAAGAGGGVIRLEIADTLTVHGTITAKGAGSAGAGAGGSVSIRAAILTGDGAISADGGDYNSSSYGGGGGGRIAVLDYTLLAGAFAIANIPEDTFGVRAQGGDGGGCYDGAAGTVYLRALGATHGSLLIDNGARCVQTTTTTELPAVVPGVIGAGQLTSQTLTEPGATWEQDVWNGSWLTPNRDEGASTLADNTVFSLVDHGDDYLTVAEGDMTQVASAGDRYGTLYQFENLEVRRKGNLTSHADVLVNSGDLGSDDDVTFVLPSDCTLDVSILDLQGVTTLDGSPVVEALLCSGCNAP
ncbi:MAG: hypothetical protein ACPGU1_19180, partial [Myxococcota bacterium]